jgi:hypothetical protein
MPPLLETFMELSFRNNFQHWHHILLAVFHVQKSWSLQCGSNFERATSNWAQNQATKEWGWFKYSTIPCRNELTGSAQPSITLPRWRNKTLALRSFVFLPPASRSLSIISTHVWLTVCSCPKKHASELFQDLLWIAHLCSFPRFVDASWNIYATANMPFFANFVSYTPESTAHSTLPIFLNFLKTRSNLLYTINQSVPRSKHFPPRLQKPISS